MYFIPIGKAKKNNFNQKETFSYDNQAIIYNMLVVANFDNLIKSGYTVEFNFITIDKNLQTYAFKLTEKTLMRWLSNFKIKLDQLDYHYQNKDYTLPYAFAVGAIEL